MGLRGLAVMVVVCSACGRLGFDPARDDGADDTDAVDTTDDPDGVDDTDGTEDTDDTDDTDEVVIDAPPSACIDDPAYVSLGAFPSRYHRVTTLMSWMNAAILCDGEGAHLAIPDTLAEAMAIGDNGDWVGIIDAVSEGTWMTIFDEVPNYLVFQTGQPDGGNSEDCLRVDDAGEFEDRDCDDARDFVCECPQ